MRRHLHALPYRSFLLVLVQLLEQEGYSAVRLVGREGFVGRNRGGGWDLEAAAPAPFGSAGGSEGVRCIIQAKQFDTLAVQQRTVDELRGCCLRAGAGQGLLITTSRFSPVAARAAEASALAPVALIDGDRLVDLLLRHGLGVVRSERGRWQLDPEFFHTLSAKADTLPEGKATVPASAERQTREHKRGRVLIEPRMPHARSTAMRKNAQPTVLHFSITLDAKADDMGGKTRKL